MILTATGRSVQIDEEDLPLLEGRTPYLKRGYVYIQVGARHKRRDVNVARLILGLPPGTRKHDGLHVDHINRDTTDNRRSNLRLVTHAENMQNRGAHVVQTSRHRGVYYRPTRSKPWCGAVQVRHRRITRYFDTEIAAFAFVLELRAQRHPFSAEGRSAAGTTADPHSVQPTEGVAA